MTATGGLAPQVLEILLVEDNPADVLLVEDCLRDLSVVTRLHLARDAAEAMAILRNIGSEVGALVPDLVLLDLHLPCMDGLEFLAWIRATAPVARLKVVVLTGSASQADVARCRELGVDGYELKAFDMSELPRVAHAIEAHLASIVRPAALQ